ncbi:DUF1707 SHOCT-like domain-containing protein [Paractinoplanes toevensis]|uniref:DUF1707 domain-containing protein n=1 Tax=Paractinoplanes toevensis TaxID=571911 RepID=A0A919W4Z6_9ACTN|nr:DUF1707 domain-containing protein [Actinoplanes toevensis]GIM92285.1 hypothetical protein Ato02nite_040780 [Actinoplanes toevensis]
MVRDHRVGPAERTQVLGLLGNAFEAGVLPVGDYDARVTAVGTATHASQLRLQISDLPPAYAWGELPPLPPEATPASGRIALVLGIASVPMSVCGIGFLLGLLAVIASRGGGPEPGGPRVTPALIGRIFGFIGIALSIVAVVAVLIARP